MYLKYTFAVTTCHKSRYHWRKYIFWWTWSIWPYQITI